MRARIHAVLAPVRRRDEAHPVRQTFRGGEELLFRQLACLYAPVGLVDARSHVLASCLNNYAQKITARAGNIIIEAIVCFCLLTFRHFDSVELRAFALQLSKFKLAIPPQPIRQNVPSPRRFD